MRPLAPLINVLGLLLWWCLTGLGARLERGASAIAIGARRGGFWRCQTSQAGQIGSQPSKSGVESMRAARSKKPC